MPTSLPKSTATMGYRSRVGCKDGLRLIRDIIVSMFCGGTAGLVIAIVGNSL
jgi:hypothetical protein